MPLLPCSWSSPSLWWLHLFSHLAAAQGVLHLLSQLQHLLRPTHLSRGDKAAGGNVVLSLKRATMTNRFACWQHRLQR